MLDVFFVCTARKIVYFWHASISNFAEILLVLANNMSEIFPYGLVARGMATAKHRLRIIETYTCLW